MHGHFQVEFLVLQRLAVVFRWRLCKSFNCTSLRGSRVLGLEPSNLRHINSTAQPMNMAMDVVKTITNSRLLNMREVTSAAASEETLKGTITVATIFGLFCMQHVHACMSGMQLLCKYRESDGLVKDSHHINFCNGADIFCC